jgi:hypothetical protein
LFEEKTEVVIPQPDYEMPSPHEFYPNWFFPFKGKSLGTLRPYNKLLTGKYHKPVAKRRIRWKMRSNHVSEFKDLILKHEGPLSKEAFQMLSATTEKDVNWDGFLFREGNIDPETFCDFQILRKEPSNFVPLSAASGFPLALPASLTAGINFTEKEFELSRIQIEPKLLKVSLPGRFRNLFETQSGPRLWSQAHIVLTPSYQVRDKWWVDDLVDQTLQNSTPDPSKCRLNFGNNIIHILLVRSSQYEAYQKAWGNTHIIIKLPDKLRYLPNHKLHMQNNEFSVEDGGVGFARLVGQIWAYERNIEHCFMFDDNVICCFELMKAVDSTLSQTPVPFTRVMDQMTAILTKNSKELSTSEQEYYMLT